MRTRSWKVALLLFDEVELLDFAGAAQVLTVAGRQWNWRPFKLLPVAGRAGSVATRSGLDVSTAAAADVSAEILLVPGGYGARRAAEDRQFVELVHSLAERADLVAAVGYGVLLLAAAGLIGESEVAARGEIAELLGSGVRCDPSRRVIDAGRILTAQGGAASIDLGLAIVSRLLGNKQALAVASALGYDWPEQAPLRVEVIVPEKA
jgi:transcriptional regulator GlxA family with amidase domain